MIPLLFGALAAGLLGSPHCVGMCGAFAAASSQRLAEGAAWQAGRLAAYTALGAAAGAAGGRLPVSGPVSAGIAGVLLVWFSLRLAGAVGPLPIGVVFPTRFAAALLARNGVLARFGFGVLAAFLPCGLLWSALAVAVASGSAVTGGLAMGAFWSGTVPALAVAARGLQALAAARPWTKRIVAAAVLAAGLWSIHTRATAPTEHACCHEAGR